MTSLPGDELTGDFGNETDAISISGLELFRFLAGKSLPEIIPSVVVGQIPGYSFDGSAQLGFKSRYGTIIERIDRILRSGGDGDLFDR